MPLLLFVLIWSVLLSGYSAETKPAASAEQPWKVYTEWPFSAAEAKRRQEETAKALNIPVEKAIDLGNGVSMELILIPAGRFIMGTPVKVETEGPLVIVEQARAKLQKEGMVAAFKVHVIGGGEAESEMTNMGGSSGQVVASDITWSGRRVLTLKIGPDGGVAQVTVIAGGRTSKGFVFNLGQIVLDGKPTTNRPPVIQSGPTASPGRPNTEQSVTFGVSASDPDGDSLSYAWDFNDGTTGAGTSPTHTFSTAGTYSVTVKVSDGRGGTDSGTLSLTVGGGSTQQVATPTFSPVAGTYSGTQSVTISCATSGATIYCTTDGSTPTTSSVTYSGAMTVSTTMTLKAMAAKNGMTNSAVASATYTIDVGTAATPSFSPAAGTYTSAQSVKISSLTSGATIYYTTDGSTPTTSSASYSAAITVDISMTLRAMAAKSGMTDSGVASAAYTISEITMDFGGGVTMQLVLIPAGTFTMGSPDTEAGRDNNEGPQHQVTISQPFYMGKFEVTQAQYQAVIGSNPSYFTGDLQRPVEQVSWNDTRTFCQKLSTSSGRTVRLPTEAEWEYACRAGTSTRFYSGDANSALDGVGWYYSNSNSTTHVVGQKTANAWGLYDMHGNVFEWCQDWYGSYTANALTDPQGPGSGEHRVLRGGPWYGVPQFCRSAYRISSYPYYGDYYYGFRVVVLRTQ